MNRLCLHSITTKPLSLDIALDKYQEFGINGISVWQNAATSIGIKRSARLLHESRLDVISYCRGGFFPSIDADKRKKAIDDNRMMLEEANEIGAPLVVMVCGADPDQSLQDSRSQIVDGLETLLPEAEKLNLKLSIEPLHPMYADTRSAINTMQTANDIVENINSPILGVTIDVYHVWWDPDLQNQVHRCGNNKNIFSFHICDWKVPTTDFLFDRGIPGEGCINLREINDWVYEAGFEGYREVEIFSNKYWNDDQDDYLKKIVNNYKVLFNKK
jgi:sugar phosphate isomerase/epimerase